MLYMWTQSPSRKSWECLTPHHPCLCASSLRCLSCLGEYGLNLFRVLSFPSCLSKSRDEIFLRGGDCHNPGKKKRKENKNPVRAPPVSLPSPSPPLFCSAPRHASPVAGQPRLPCHAPAIPGFRAAPSLFPRSLSLSASRPTPVPRLKP